MAIARTGASFTIEGVIESGISIPLVISISGELKMAKELPKLSPTETEILQRVCQLQKACVTEVYDSFPDKRGMSYTTVQTLLRRLEKKGYLKHNVRGNAHIYTSTVRQDTLINRSITEFL